MKIGLISCSLFPGFISLWLSISTTNMHETKGGRMSYEMLFLFYVVIHNYTELSSVNGIIATFCEYFIMTNVYYQSSQQYS